MAKFHKSQYFSLINDIYSFRIRCTIIFVLLTVFEHSILTTSCSTVRYEEEIENGSRISDWTWIGLIKTIWAREYFVLGALAVNGERLLIVNGSSYFLSYFQRTFFIGFTLLCSTNPTIIS